MKNLKTYSLFEANIDFHDIDPENPLTADDSVNYVAKHAIGERVKFTFNQANIPAYVRIIYHTNGKVRYSLRLEGFDERLKGEGEDEDGYYMSTIHNVDSIFVESYPDEEGNRVILDLKDMEDFDNYS